MSKARSGGEPPPEPRLQLVLAACVVAEAAGAWAGFVAHAPNRLVSGAPSSFFHAAPAAALAAFLILLAVQATGAVLRHKTPLALAAALLIPLLLLYAAGHAAATLARHGPPAARTSLGAGFWIMLFAAALAALDALSRLRATPALRLAAAAAVLAAATALAFTHQLDQLSLAREYAAHHIAFAQAVGRHVWLVAGTLAGVAVVGLPTGLLAQRHKRLRPPVFGVLNVVQTVPSVALFGLLIAPLAASGLSGIGVVPALIALVAYGLLPATRGIVAGLDGVDPAAVEAARGMGLAPAQILLRVELPLAAPALLAALRIVIVQAVGLAVVAALIGAGGLGDFVFQGLGQYAVDLVLLGALPAILIALAADGLLRVAAAHFA